MTPKKSNSDCFRMDIESKGVPETADDWTSAMADLEKWNATTTAAPATPCTPCEQPTNTVTQSAPPCAEPAVAKPARPLTRYEQLCRQKSVIIESDDVEIMTEFSEIISHVNEIARMVEKLEKEYPDYVPQRFIDMWSQNLKETSMVMLKEFHALRHGKEQKKYDKRNICCGCHSVFMVPLPADGMCDECRAYKTSKANRRVLPPGVCPE